MMLGRMTLGRMTLGRMTLGRVTLRSTSASIRTVHEKLPKCRLYFQRKIKINFEMIY